VEKTKENQNNKSPLQNKKVPTTTQGSQGKITLPRALFVGFIITAIIILGFQSNNTQLKAPDFVLEDIRGDEVALNDYKGTVVLLEFMATWCPTCREETVELEKISQSYGKQVVIISISSDPSYDSTARLATYVLDHDISWSVCRDTEGVTSAYGVGFIPSLFLIDQQQKIRWNQGSGDLASYETLSEQIAQLL